jgi:hypothetical protein
LSRLPGGRRAEGREGAAGGGPGGGALDNRFGLINYDLLHWSNVWKDVAFL